MAHTCNIDTIYHTLIKNNKIDTVLSNLLRNNSSNRKFNSIRNKFDGLRHIISGNIDILSIAETKIDNFFSTAQFSLERYHSPYRLDISNRSGGIFV